MKTIYILTLLWCVNSFSQIVIEKADGGIVQSSEVSFNTEGEKVIYKENGKRGKLKYRDMKISVDG